jgi:hypothetical protein
LIFYALNLAIFFDCGNRRGNPYGIIFSYKNGYLQKYEEKEERRKKERKKEERGKRRGVTSRREEVKKAEEIHQWGHEAIQSSNGCTRCALTLCL